LRWPIDQLGWPRKRRLANFGWRGASSKLGTRHELVPRTKPLAGPAATSSLAPAALSRKKA